MLPVAILIVIYANKKNLDSFFVNYENELTDLISTDFDKFTDIEVNPNPLLGIA